jgi:hypothetical protein
MAVVSIATVGTLAWMKRLDKAAMQVLGPESRRVPSLSSPMTRLWDTFDQMIARPRDRSLSSLSTTTRHTGLSGE